MANKKNSNFLLFAVIGVVLLFFLFSASKPKVEGGVESGITNKGVGMSVYAVDRNGKILDRLGGNSPLSAVSLLSQTGFLNIDPDGPDDIPGNADDVFLALGMTPDNSLGTSEVTLNSIAGSNPCANGNPLYGTAPCTGITNIFGGTGAGKGDLTSKFTFPIILGAGAIGSQTQSGGMDVTPLELVTSTNIINFTATMTGTFKDEFGADIPISPPPFGSVVLKISPTTCSGGTPTLADPNSADADAGIYCQQAGGEDTGKYCRVDAFGDPKLTDHAAFCGCPTGQIQDGEVCKVASCTPWTCISGTVSFCLADGQTYETRCQECTGGVLAEIQSRCPLAGAQQATSCDPATSGVISQCIYPQVAGSSFKVGVVNPAITEITQCGDGVKNGAEQCDTFDLGGQTCTTQGYAGGTLACDMETVINPEKCVFNISSCGTNYVAFRTSDIRYGASTAVAISPWYSGGLCWSNLIPYGQLGTTCRAVTDATCPIISGLTLIETNLPGGPLWAQQNTGCIYSVNGSSPPEVRTYFKKTGSGGPCVTTGQWGANRYTSTDPDIDQVSDSYIPTGINELIVTQPEC